MKTADFIKELRNEKTGAIQRLYKVTPFVQYEERDSAGVGEIATTEYILVSAVVALGSGPEVLIFPADKRGTVLYWGELGGRRGTLDHQKVLHEEGYTIHEKEMIPVTLTKTKD